MPKIQLIHKMLFLTEGILFSRRIVNSKKCNLLEHRKCVVWENLVGNFFDSKKRRSEA
jgi:hypothetical protein